jgi:Photosynthesis system II assembly factor YCF48/Putative zinc-finger
MAELPTPIIERLRAAAPTSDHLDPDLISAFLESALHPRDRNRVIEHLACCSQCREISALSLPEHVKAAPGSAALTWLGWPVLRWGAVAACLLVLAVVLARQQAALRPLQLARSEPAVPEPQPTAAAPLPGPAGSPPQPLARKAAAPLHEAHASALPATKVAQGRKAESGDQDEPVIAVVNDAPSAALEEAVPGRAKEVREEADNSRHSEPVGEAGLASMQTASPALAFEKAGTPRKLVPRWTLTSDGTLERSFDAGNTWETVPLPSQARFHVLSAHGMDIWLGGSGGALYHSSDAGGRWIQVQPVVNGQALSEDVIGMEFVDDDHGVLTTSTNQKWSTEDCGQSWQKSNFPSPSSP